MNTSSLKSFAPAVRRQLIEAVGRKLDYVLSADTPDLRQAATQVTALRKEATKNRAALIERVAYTWFNRLAALRFLDARGWHPFKARVLTPGSPEETQPEILKLLRSGSLPEELRRHTELQRLNDLLDGRLPTAIAGANPQGETYRQLILATCRFYHALMPFLFEAIDDETELLLPDDLLTATSVAEHFRTEISDADCAEVEILGWLYQFYISERKDDVMARKSAVPAEDIPAITQLFTPHWIVRYLVENSLGRLWMLNRPDSRLREHMPYYIDSEPETDFLKVSSPEEIRLVDPAVGSGHMLTYAFDLMVKIYEDEGYAPSDIWEKILTHNLFGLEICPRAAQLAQFALVCKAREQSRTAFRHPIQPQVLCLQDVDITQEEMKAWLTATRTNFTEEELSQTHQFRQNMDSFGSLVQPLINVNSASALRVKIGDAAPEGDLLLQDTHRKLKLVMNQAEMLGQRYHVVVANPPYVWEKRLNAALKTLLSNDYPNFKSNLFSAFYARSGSLALNDGMIGFMTPNVWMFLSSYEKLRAHVLHAKTLKSLVQLENGAFESAAVAICAFVTRSCKPKPEDSATFIRLTDFKGSELQEPKTLEAIQNKQCDWRFERPLSDFRSIPGEPLAYWIDASYRKAFEQFEPLTNHAEARQGLATGYNDIFLRFWPEVSFGKFRQGCSSRSAASESGGKWFPYNKGGSFRKWYGNQEFILNWENDGFEIKKRKADDLESGKCTANNAKCWNQDYYFRSGLSWSGTGIETFGARFTPPGFVFDVKGSTCFVEQSVIISYLAYFNSIIPTEFLKILNPTTEFQAGNIKLLPLAGDLFSETFCSKVEPLATSALRLSTSDWNNFETSWNFSYSPLIRPGNWEIEPDQPVGPSKGHDLAESWKNYASYCKAAIQRMQELETANNRLWIDVYGLSGELDPEVPEEQITLALPDAREDVAAFLSYAVGCMMGRYSPDHPGLILANAGDTLENFRSKIVDGGLKMEDLTFAPDDDAIIPVLDGEWFEDDIVSRTREFLRATFGEATLKQNLRFIEDSLGKPLEKYFLTDFYKDHLQTYKKRPIYWLFQSPKKGFSALVYLHRYTKDTVNTLLNKYLRDYLKKLEARIAHLTQVEATSTVTKEKNAARKEADKLKKALKDCQDWERNVILPLAQQRLEIDLDDGVKTNYLKFVGAVQAIPGLAAKED